MKLLSLCLGLCLFSSSLNPIFAQVQTSKIIAQSDRIRRIQFEQGEISATLEDGVIRGTRNTYLLGANESQIMTIALTSLENNAVFNLVAPNYTILQQEVTNTHLILPANGDYKIIVGGTRGNANYKLYVEIYDVLSTQTIKTENYHIILRSHCREGAVTCHHVSYEGININTGDRIQLAGKTIHITCPDGVTPCRFLGYQFVNGDYTYIVRSDGSLLVYQANNLILREEGNWQN
ncbi:hypothetical protein [Crocosphaera sp.]|uniref:hypothetical protein n=1 Tax=Crocosphaera sp. TaxID=2729996 RepID=UPI003F28AF1C|nr:hypothetical protein [Crocosphaera sp.]